MKNLFP